MDGWMDEMMVVCFRALIMKSFSVEVILKPLLCFVMSLFFCLFYVSVSLLGLEQNASGTLISCMSVIS